jgi:hypothetical protein
MDAAAAAMSSPSVETTIRSMVSAACACSIV